MGFCLPMSYYIGSNVKNVSQENIKKVIYILCLGMCVHLVLNFIYDISIVGEIVLKKYSHYDIWTREKIETTGTAVNYVLMNAIIYYLFVYEDNRNNKYIGIFLFVIIMIYEFGLGKRSPILLLAIAIFISTFLDLIVFKNRKLNNKKNKYVLLYISFFFALLVIILITNAFDIRTKIGSLHLILKFKDGIIDFERLKIFSQAI